MLYSSLAPSERKAIRTYLDAFHQKGENKNTELLKLLDQDPNISHEEASTKLYGDPRTKAFIMMKHRLIERLIEFMTLSVNPDYPKRDRETPSHQDLIEYRRCMLFASSLQERQIYPLALDYLEKARALAERCNAPELEVDVLLRLRGMDRSGMDRLEELSIQIQRALKQQECDINATGLMRKFLMLNGTAFGAEEERIAFLETHLPGLEESIRQVYSVRADYFLQMLRTHLCYLNLSFEDGRTYAKAALQLLIDHEGIRSPTRMTDSWFQLGRMELRQERYSEALASLEKAKSFQPDNSRGYLTTSLLILYCMLYLRNLKGAAALIEDLRHGRIGKLLEQNPTNKGLLTYLRACLCFYRNEMKEAWQLVQECQDITLGKDHWVTGIRLFEIMILVERNDADLASQRLESLRKHMSRYAPTPRMKAIFKMLQAQDRTGFRFTPITDEAQQLENLRKNLHWDTIDQEVVRFEDWYQARRSKAR